MTIEYILSTLFSFIDGILDIELPVGQYNISFWNILIYGFIIYIVFRIFYGIGAKGGDG